jgi:hypothetical protein
LKILGPTKLFPATLMRRDRVESCLTDHGQANPSETSKGLNTSTITINARQLGVAFADDGNQRFELEQIKVP